MPNQRDLSPKYGISSNRYRELVYFVKQYGEKKARIKSSHNCFKASTFDNIPRTHGNSSWTENAALRYDAEKRDIEAIEKSARKACNNVKAIYEPLLLNVTEGLTYEQLMVPCGKNQFFQYRRLFFVILDNELHRGVN